MRRACGIAVGSTTLDSDDVVGVRLHEYAVHAWNNAVTPDDGRAVSDVLAAG